MFAINYVLILTFIGTLGLDSASIHFAAKFKAEGALDRLRRLYQHTTLIALIGGSLLVTIGILVASLSLKVLAFSAIFSFVLAVPFALTQMYGLGILLGLHDLAGYSALFITQPAFFLLSIFLLYVVGHLEVLTIALALLSSYGVTATIVLLRTVRHIPGVFTHLQTHSGELREQIVFSCFIYINMIGLLLDSRWPILVLGWLGQTDQIADYSLSIPITEASLQIARSVGLVLLARASAGYPPTRTQLLRVPFLYIPAMGLLVIFAPWGVPWLFGSGYTPATLLIQTLAPGMIPLAAGILHTSVQTGMGRPQVGALAAACSLTAMIALSMFLIPHYKAVGAAIATGLAYIVYWGVAVALNRKI